MNLGGPTDPSLAHLAGLGEDPADLDTDLHPYLRLAGVRLPRPVSNTQGYLELAERRLRTRRLTPGGSPQPPELVGVDADPRVPNVLQPMSGEMNQAGVVNGAQPAFHNPTLPPATGIASAEAAAPGLLQRNRNARATPPPQWLAAEIVAIGNERPSQSILAPRRQPPMARSVRPPQHRA